MKKLLLITAVLFSLLCRGQEYKIGAGLTHNLTFKVEGTLSITDTELIFVIQGQKKVFEVQKKANDIVYFTDGVMTHFLYFIKESGKKKGFNYTTVIVYNFDARLNASQLYYYGTP